MAKALPSKEIPAWAAKVAKGAAMADLNACEKNFNAFVECLVQVETKSKAAIKAEKQD